MVMFLIISFQCSGVPVKRYGPKTAPNDIVPDIEELLKEEA